MTSSIKSEEDEDKANADYDVTPSSTTARYSRKISTSNPSGRWQKNKTRERNTTCNVSGIPEKMCNALQEWVSTHGKEADLALSRENRQLSMNEATIVLKLKEDLQSAMGWKKVCHIVLLPTCDVN